MNLEGILKYAGIGGLGIALLFLFFKEIIKKNIFSKLGQIHSYKILRLITILLTVASLACICGYFVTLRNETNAKISKDSIKTDDHHISSTGNNNTNVSGNNNTINFANAVPTYDQDEIRTDSLAEFLEKNDGKIVYLNILMDAWNNASPEDYKTIDGFEFSKTPVVIAENEEDDEGYKRLVFNARMKSEYTYLDKEEKMTKYYYYRADEITCTVVINKINKDLVYQEHGFILVKGRYLIKYYLGGQGHHIATLSPREIT